MISSVEVENDQTPYLLSEAFIVHFHSTVTDLGRTLMWQIVRAMCKQRDVGTEL